MDYPLPTAEPPEIERVQRLYREEYDVELTQAQAKDLLERVMQFIFLTEMSEVEYALRSLREEIQRV